LSWIKNEIALRSSTIAGLERVTGPSHGVYIAAYTTELDGLFHGYAKLCTARPADVWTAQAELKVTTRSGLCDEQSALAEVENLALRVIAELRSPENQGFWSALVTRARGI
jgi:hypothetical protein